MDISKIPAGKKVPDEIYVFVENEKGSQNKLEFDKDLGVMALDRVLYTSEHYPGSYGFIPQTLCGDGDPMDVIVLCSLPIPSGTLVSVRPVAIMGMEDEKGLDDKIVAVPVKDPRFDEIKDLKDLPAHIPKEIAHFFETMKQLEPGKWVKVKGWEGAAAAKKAILESIALAKKKK